MITQAMYERWRDTPPKSNSVPPAFLDTLRRYVLFKYLQKIIDGEPTL